MTSDDAPVDTRRFCPECGARLGKNDGERCGKCLDAAEDREDTPPVWRAI